MALVLGIHASHGPGNRSAPLEQTQIFSRLDTPTALGVAGIYVI